MSASTPTMINRREPSAHDVSALLIMDGGGQ